MKEGIEQVFKQFKTVLEKEGLTEIESKAGEIVNTDFHDVITKEKSELEENAIIETIQKGYIYKEMILRHSKVRVSNGEGDNSKS